MLRITQQDSAQGAKSYYTKSDYLSEGQEICGLWGGKGAQMLGLEGVVDKLSFDRLCDNLNPRDGSKLTVRTRSDRTVGYDFTFSGPKSLSLLYALTGDQQILDAFRSAVDETMREDIEPEMKTRVRKGGKNEERVTGNMVWAEFIHTTSRPVGGVPDPQVHAHVFCMNATHCDSEHRWKSGQFRDLKASAPLYQAAFRVRLANKLQDLGFGIIRHRDDFEIAGMDAAVLKRFSRRTAQIERMAEEKGITDPKAKAQLGAKTREAKSHDLSWNQLRREWDSRLTNSERAALAQAHRREHQPARTVGQEKAAVDHALDHCFVREAVVPERKLLTEALKRGIGSVAIDDVRRELAGRKLIRAERGGVVMTSTPAMKHAEAKVIRFARDGRGHFRPFCPPEQAITREWLNQGQMAAVRFVLGSRDRVVLVRGPAGTGKTTLEEELGDALKGAGVPVVALAQSASAVDVLRQEAHFEKADTVARFLVDEKMQSAAKDGLVLVDEASLLGTKDMLGLFDICQDIGARVCLVGDTKQNRSVSAGEPLRLLETRSGLPTVQVTEIVRQRGDYAKAAKALSDGRTADGFDELHRLGWIKEIPDNERYQAMADAYLAASQEKKRNGEYKTALAVSPTWAEAARITQAVRGVLKAEKKLGEARTLDVWVPAHLTEAQKRDDAGWIGPGDLLKFHQNAAGFKNGARVVVTKGMQLPLEAAKHFEVYRPALLEVAVGDRLRFTANGKDKSGKHDLRNGALMTVKKILANGDLVDDHGWIISKDWGHIAHGYAVSSENSQGRTVDKVFVGMASESLGAANERRFYVANTRGREQTLVFTDDRQALLKAVQKRDRPLSAIELDEARRRHTPWRQRLKKHWAMMRRLAAQAQARIGRGREMQHTPHHEREAAHGR
jgi:conjugative relaxase-like TrwC/TraI family protein